MLLNAGASYALVAAVAGLMIGSFLNVCIYRVPRDMSVVAPRSFCPECGEQIAWYDNIPIVSYVVLRGRCRRCRAHIPIRYVLVELATAVLFGAVVAKFGVTLTALKWAVFEAVLVVLFWTDLEELLLPDEFTLGGTAAGLAFAAFVAVPGQILHLLIPRAGRVARSYLNAAAGALLLAAPISLFAWMYARVRKREGLGWGDVKLLVFMGVFLGPETGLTALVIGSVTGCVIGLGYIIVARKDAATYPLPFGSFLCVGAAAAPFLERG